MLAGRVLLLGALLVGAAAEASPAFARKYNVSCQACHGPAYPELNALGRQFKENGFQYPAGAEPAYRERETLTPGTIAERIGLWRELPLAARIVGHVQVPTHPGASERNAANLKLIDNLYLLGGGSLYPDVSVFFSTSLAPSPVLHHAALGVHNLLGDGYLNVRAGQLLLLDFLYPEHRGLDRAGNPGAITRVGLNPTTLDSSQLGIDVYGRLLDRRLFYELAVVQGAQGEDGLSDLDSNKDLFGQLQFIFQDQNVLGVLGYLGRTQITDTTRAVEVRFTDPMWIVGGNVEYHLGPARLFGYVLRGRHGNPLGTDEAVSYTGVRSDLTVPLTPSLVGRVRYDGVFSSDDHSLERQVVTTHLTYLLLTNLKASAEFGADLSSFDRSTVYLTLDVAL